MLNLSTRADYKTLLDAAVLQDNGADETAIIYVASDAEPITITRQYFKQRAQRYGAALVELGIQAKDLVVIAHTQNIESMEAFWGAMLVGAIPSMFPTLTEKLDPDVYTQNMGELVSNSDVRCILTTDEFAPQLRHYLDCPILASSQIPDAGTVKPYHANPDAIAFLQHSSGTTGLQKGVALSHDAVLNQLAAYGDAIAISEDDVIVSWLPLYHDMGLIAGFMQPLVQGVPLVLMSPFDWVRRPALLLNAIDEHNGTLCWLPNFAYNHMARRVRKRDAEGISLASMRAFINCSEPVRHDSHLQFMERFGVDTSLFTVSYAMAENTFAVTQTSVGDYPTLDIVDTVALQAEKIARPASDDATATVHVSCGKPIANTTVKVIDVNGKHLDERHVGELIVSSNCMLTEYYKRPDLVPFIDGWYRTGDMGYIANSEVYIVGRKKDLIINAGKNVYPQDIESIVNTVAGVHPGRAVCFGVPDEREGTELLAIVAEVDTDDVDERKSIGGAIRQKVAQETTVTLNFVTLVESRWLLKTSSGKIARAANRDKWMAERKR